MDSGSGLCPTQRENTLHQEEIRSNKIDPFASTNRKIKTAGGFSAILLLSILSFLITLLWTFEMIIAYSQLKMIPLQICRIYQLEIQTKSAETLRLLQKLNPLVHKLRVELHTAQIGLATATASQNLAGIAAATNSIERIKVEQQALQEAQKSILLRSSLTISSLQNKIADEVKRDLHLENQKIKEWINLRVDSVVSPPHRLAVRPDREAPEPSIYEPVEDFSTAQTSSSFWSLRLSPKKEHWVSRALNGNTVLTETCGASLFKEKSEWKEKLWDQETMAKFSLNHF